MWWRHRFTRSPSPTIEPSACLRKWSEQRAARVAYDGTELGVHDTEEEARSETASVFVGTEAGDFDYEASEASLEAARPCSLEESLLNRAHFLLAEAEEPFDAPRLATARRWAHQWTWRHRPAVYERWLQRAYARLHFANERFFLEDRLFKRAAYNSQFSDLKEDAQRRRHEARQELARAYRSACLLHEISQNKAI